MLALFKEYIEMFGNEVFTYDDENDKLLISRDLTISDSDIKLGDIQGVYSTEEVRVGTWIDGKPLYRRTFTKTYYEIGIVNDVLLENIDNAFLLFGWAKGSGGTKVGFESGGKAINVNSSNQMVVSITNSTTVAYNVTVLYTKTTD